MIIANELLEDSHMLLSVGILALSGGVSYASGKFMHLSAAEQAGSVVMLTLVSELIIGLLFYGN